MKAMILGRNLRIQEAQTVAATLEEVTQVAAIPEAVVPTPEAATRVGATREEGTPAVEDPEGDKMTAAAPCSTPESTNELAAPPGSLTFRPRNASGGAP